MRRWWHIARASRPLLCSLPSERLQKDERKIYHLVKETEVITESGKAARVKDLKGGTMLLLTLSVEDPNTVIRIEPLPPDKQKEAGLPLEKTGGSR